MSQTNTSACMLTIVLCSWTSATGSAYFSGLGVAPPGTHNSYAHDVSADGSVVVGHNDSGAAHQAFRWTSDSGMVRLELPGGSLGGDALGVSGDGNVVVGVTRIASGSFAFRWTLSDGMAILGNAQSATDVSADGSVVVGSDGRWTTETGWTPLGFDVDSISADGSTVVGSEVTPASSPKREAIRWTEEDGAVALGDLLGGGYESRSFDVSADGTAIVGTSDSVVGTEAFRWTADEGMVGIGFLPGDHRSYALGISANGSRIVGFSGFGSSNAAFLWDATSGMRSLADLLVNDHGLDLSGWDLTSADSITPDGLTIVGYGRNPEGDLEAWIARLPEPTSVMLLMIGTMFAVKR
jgi:hypothetical protein